MIPYRLDYTIETVLEDQFSSEQKFIRQLTGKLLPKTEAKKVWRKIQEHKWYLGENLRRDVGLRVAAVDFLENIYNQQKASGSDPRNTFRRALRAFTVAA